VANRTPDLEAYAARIKDRMDAKHTEDPRPMRETRRGPQKNHRSAPSPELEADGDHSKTLRRRPRTPNTTKNST
jgi:hypothetical protein